MYVHLYSRGEDFFKEKINVDDACKLMELQESVEQEEENFIGFTHPSSDDSFIQFIRMKADEWVVDIPIFHKSEFKGSYLSEINHSLALIIVVEFYHKTPFQTAFVNRDYDELLNICRTRW